MLRYLLLLPAAAGSGMEIALVLALNAIGCAAMGWFKPGPFWGMGVLGGFTTFSAFSLDTLRLLEGGRAGAALLYAGGSVGLSLLACAAGLHLGRPA